MPDSEVQNGDEGFPFTVLSIHVELGALQGSLLNTDEWNHGSFYCDMRLSQSAGKFSYPEVK